MKWPYIVKLLLRNLRKKEGTDMVLIGYLLVCLIFGTTFLAIKIGIDASLPPFFSAGMRFLAAGLILFAWMAWRRKANFALLLRKEMLINGFCLTFGTFSCLYWAEQYVSSGIAAVLSATGTLIILVLQTVVYHKKTSTLSAIGCIVGFAGVVLLLLPKLAVSSGLWWILGAATILVGEMFYASGALFSKQVIQRFPETSPIALNAAQMIYGGLLLLILSSLTEHVRFHAFLTPGGIGSFMYLTVIGSMVGHTLFYWLVAKTNPVFPSTWLYISPIIALTIGVIFYREDIAWSMAIGGVTIITGTVLANWDTLIPLLRKPQTAAPKLRRHAKALE
jgi:drug/metabolite transporter (DMT)-like permease